MKNIKIIYVISQILKPKSMSNNTGEQSFVFCFCHRSTDVKLLQTRYKSDDIISMSRLWMLVTVSRWREQNAKACKKTPLFGPGCSAPGRVLATSVCWKTVEKVSIIYTYLLLQYDIMLFNSIPRREFLILSLGEFCTLLAVFVWF